MSKYEEQFEKETGQTLGCTNEYIDWLEERLQKSEDTIRDIKIIMIGLNKTILEVSK
jgi:archaellum component FlaC